jgi:DnaK suppressor protein
MTAKQKTATSLDFFSQAFLDEMKVELESQLIEAETELSKFTHKATDGSDDSIADFPNIGSETDDDVQEVEAFIVNKPMQIVIEKKLRDVKKALARFEDNSYGICKYTGEAIDERRLRARPTSSSSVEAKKLLTDEA